MWGLDPDRGEACVGAPRALEGLRPTQPKPPVKGSSGIDLDPLVRIRPVLLAFQKSQKGVLQRGVPHLVERRTADRTKLGTPQ